LKEIILAVLFLYSSALFADDLDNYKKGLDTEINLNASETARLILYDGYSKYDGEHKTELKGLIKIAGENINYLFQDSDNNWPAYVWPDSKVNTVLSDFTDLRQNCILDLDGNGENEIFIYGESSHGSGYMGKVFSFENKENRIIQKYPVFSGINHFSINYYRPKNIIIEAGYIPGKNEGFGGEGSDGDGFYEFYLSEPSNSCKETIKLAISRNKHTTEYGPGVIEENIYDIVKKYDLYKKGPVEEKEKEEIGDFAKKYWDLLSKAKFQEIKGYLSNKITYYSLTYTADEVIKDKKRLITKNKSIKFKLSNFLIYKEAGVIKVEYDKYFESEKGKSYGNVRSLLELIRTDNKYEVKSEKDTFTYSLGADRYE
jgi:hypothetical protein